MSSLTAGTQLGPYEILSFIGEGGMGSVYRARDSRLERIVAVKVSKEAFEERFRTEALAVAALNHPHICTLHDVGPNYIVMEYVEGKPLRGPLPPAEVLTIAGEILSALEHAHGRGIVHRDLKPGNILQTRGGVKILDFGLARRALDMDSDAAESAPTRTRPGTILGTPQYMSPEQVEGKAADERSDLFSLGVVLYELMAGEAPFPGTTAAAVMAATLEREPVPLSVVKPETPPVLAEVVHTCLAKSPADRWQSAREVRHTLAWTSRVQSMAPRAARGRWWLAGLAVVALVLATAAAAIVGGSRGRSSQAEPEILFEIPQPELADSNAFDLAVVSPDGRTLAYTAGSARRSLWVRRLNELAPRKLIDGVSSVPFWSPDSEHLAFHDGDQHLRRIDVATGATAVVAPLKDWRGGAWSQEGVIVVSSGGRLMRVPASGGELTPLSPTMEGDELVLPQFLPDGRALLGFSPAVQADRRGTYLMNLDGRRPTLLVREDGAARYVASGHLLFVRNGTLMALPFDAARGTVQGPAVALVERVFAPSLQGGNLTRRSGGSMGSFSASTQVLAWRPGGDLAAREIAWFGPDGRRLGAVGEPGDYSNLALSPDGTKLAVSRRETPASGRDIFVFDLKRGARSRLTFDAGDDTNPIWSPDGARIAFSSDRRGERDLYVKRADGAAEEELLVQSPERKSMEDWTPDGRFLIYNGSQAGGASDVRSVSTATPRSPRAVVVTGFAESEGQVSPDGRWLAYSSDESGRGEVYVRPLSTGGVAGGGRWQISNAGGGIPRWRRDGRAIFYLAGNTLTSVEVTGRGDRFEVGMPRAMFDVRLPTDTVRGRAYVPAKDGRSFVFIAIPAETAPNVLHVLSNWQARLNR